MMALLSVSYDRLTRTSGRMSLSFSLRANDEDEKYALDMIGKFWHVVQQLLRLID